VRIKKREMQAVGIQALNDLWHGYRRRAPKRPNWSAYPFQSLLGRCKELIIGVRHIDGAKPRG
jgi:hypothetical protein